MSLIALLDPSIRLEEIQEVEKHVNTSETRSAKPRVQGITQIAWLL